MQSGLNQSRIYLAFATNSFLVYPLESIHGKAAASDQQDLAKMQSLAFDDVKTCLLERICRILENNKLRRAEEESVHPNTTLIHQAIMKAVCYSQQWVKNVAKSS